MPLYYFRCTSCGEQVRKILTPQQASSKSYLCLCGGKLERTPLGPSSQAREVLDNGLMLRAVDRPAEAEELYRTRAKEVEEARKKKS